MKNLMLFCLLVLAFASCKKEPTSMQLDPGTMFYIKGTPQTKSANTEHLSNLEIVKQTTEISFSYKPTGKPAGRSFASEQRDTISSTPKLLMWATDIIALDGQLQADWIEASDVVFVKYDSQYIGHDPSTFSHCDTIAYIPNAVLRIAETAIREAYAAKDIEACYNLFNTAYSFTPITGAEWRELKMQGLN